MGAWERGSVSYRRLAGIPQRELRCRTHSKVRVRLLNVRCSAGCRALTFSGGPGQAPLGKRRRPGPKGEALPERRSGYRLVGF